MLSIAIPICSQIESFDELHKDLRANCARYSHQLKHHATVPTYTRIDAKFVENATCYTDGCLKVNKIGILSPTNMYLVSRNSALHCVEKFLN